jgi:hypothetical protein
MVAGSDCLIVFTDEQGRDKVIAPNSNRYVANVGFHRHGVGRCARLRDALPNDFLSSLG